MMNRIILIGNGFDLAHGLPTSYKEFIENYWTQWPQILKSCNSSTCFDKLGRYRMRWKGISCYAAITPRSWTLL